MIDNKAGQPNTAPSIRRIVGDIGGTNARFAIAENGVLGDVTTLATEDHPTFEAAVRAFLQGVADPRPLSEAAFAIAGPVDGDRIAFTNRDWQFSIAELRTRLGLTRLDVVNDFAANALALPYLGPGDVNQVGGGVAVTRRPIGVIGPGTGLGVGGLIWTPSGWEALAGEGGHATLPATTEREARAIDALRAEHGHVSAERVLSGGGLLHLYRALTAIDNTPAPARTPAEVTETALNGSDAIAVEAVNTFCAMLGTVAGNLALTLGAGGGIYIAGGIVPRLGAAFARSPFRERFEAKGRLQSYLAAIPTWVVRHPALAMVGLANLP